MCPGVANVAFIRTRDNIIGVVALQLIPPGTELLASLVQSDVEKEEEKRRLKSLEKANHLLPLAYGNQAKQIKCKPKIGM